MTRTALVSQKVSGIKGFTRPSLNLGLVRSKSRSSKLSPSVCIRRGRSSVLGASTQPIMAPRTQDLGGDPFGLLLKQRIVFLGGEVNDFVADAVVSQLLLLDSQDPTKDIKLFVNSPGNEAVFRKLMISRWIGDGWNGHL